jgi:hypothetical protein
VRDSRWWEREKGYCSPKALMRTTSGGCRVGCTTPKPLPSLDAHTRLPGFPHSGNISMIMQQTPTLLAPNPVRPWSPLLLCLRHARWIMTAARCRLGMGRRPPRPQHSASWGGHPSQVSRVFPPFCATSPQRSRASRPFAPFPPSQVYSSLMVRVRSTTASTGTPPS